MNRGDRRESIFVDDVDRQSRRRGMKTLAEACQKTDWKVHAYCQMRTHFHLVVETPNANLVEGMRLFLSAYTIRLNHPQKLFGHVFSGRHKALIVQGTSSGYLKSACDYVHLELVDSKLGENHSGELHRETAQQKVNRIISEGMSRLGWKETDLALRLLAAPSQRVGFRAGAFGICKA